MAAVTLTALAEVGVPADLGPAGVLGAEPALPGAVGVVLAAAAAGGAVPRARAPLAQLVDRGAPRHGDRQVVVRRATALEFAHPDPDELCRVDSARTAVVADHRHPIAEPALVRRTPRAQIRVPVRRSG